MIKEIKTWLRIRQFKNRILKKLPKYHPSDGMKFKWKIELIRDAIGYNSDTRKKIFCYPILKVNHYMKINMRPFGFHFLIFGYNFSKNEIYTKVPWEGIKRRDRHGNIMKENKYEEKMLFI